MNLTSGQLVESDKGNKPKTGAQNSTNEIGPQSRFHRSGDRQRTIHAAYNVGRIAEQNISKIGNSI